MIYKAELFGNEKYGLGEGPCYDPGSGRLSWVDITAGKMWQMNASGERTSFDLGQQIGAAVPVKDSDGFVLCATDGLYLYESGKAELVLNLKGLFKPYLRCNDAKADPAGRLWFGSSVSDDHPAEGNLYMLEKGRPVIRQADTKISNGLAWSSNRKTFFFSDSLKYAVFAYDHDPETGEISGCRELFGAENGVTDGLCIDSEDDLWVAYWGGRRVEHRSGRTGELLDVIDVPAEHVTSCCFGGEDLGTLFITTSGDGLSGEFDGCLFTCRPGVKGVGPDRVIL
ncbi:MAG: SMP-30/gluconolactonase/LRE family protein [Lachnospiraceae bacterium]|nr:SMP-30/gluconolactonase/LRE family protein [Lachnospiraceae bacterium]